MDNAQLLEALAGLLAEKETAKPATKRKPATRKAGSSTRKPRGKTSDLTFGISSLDAWLLLGADETYRPRDEDAAASRPASAGQLQALNFSGKLIGK